GFGGHADADVVVVDVDEVGDHADTFVEVDEGDRQRVGEGRVLGVVEDGVAVQRAATGEVDDLDGERAAVRAHGPRWVAKHAALAAALGDETPLGGRVPEHGVVVGAHGCRSFRWLHLTSHST